MDDRFNRAGYCNVPVGVTPAEYFHAMAERYHMKGMLLPLPSGRIAVFNGARTLQCVVDPKEPLGNILARITPPPPVRPKPRAIPGKLLGIDIDI
jgi:hypothetical protein